MEKKKTERIHALDALRAIMMLLGVVLHAALTYNVTDHKNAWGIKDPESNHILTDFLVLLIHSFRMPIFFFIAGFFGAMLFYERGAFKMLKNRISRIVYPFIVFLCILTPIIYFSFDYTNAVFEQLEDPLKISTQLFSNIKGFLPRTTSHLWFLYYLIFITFFTFLLGLLFNKFKKVNTKITFVFDWLMQQPILGVLFFATLTFFILCVLEISMVNASVSLVPDMSTFSYYFFFYMVGWILFKSKRFLNNFKKYDRLCIILGVSLVITQGLLIQYSGMNLNPNSNSILLISFNSLIVWLFIFGITGVFIRYSSDYSKRMRYISDASYWVYLIHLPLTAIIPAFIAELSFHALVKFIIVLSLTSLICFVTYHYLVRNTFIGKFLNGRRYVKNKEENLM